MLTAHDIHQLRHRLKETQEVFGSRFGVSSISVSYWESGRSLPTRQRLLKLQDLLTSGATRAIRAQLPFRPIQYLGSKQRLANRIADLLDEFIPAGHRVGDLFSGSGAVSHVLGANRPVTSVDVQTYSCVLSQALLTCGPSAFTQAFSDPFWDQVGEKATRLARVAAPLLDFERKAMAQAVAGDPDDLVAMIEFGSLAARRQRPLQGCPQALAACLDSVNVALTSSRLNLLDLRALYYFGGPYFSYAQALQLDAIALAAGSCSPEAALGIQAALLSTASEIVNTVGKQFAQPSKLRKADGVVQPLLLTRAIADRSRDVATTFRTWAGRWASQVPCGKDDHHVVCGDVLAFLEEDNECAAYYADPPYTIDHYSRFYHVLETLVRRDLPKLDEIIRDGRATVMRGVYHQGRYQSPFCIPSTAPAAFEGLFRRAGQRQIPILLSYSPFDEGSGARPRLLTLDGILALARSHYRSVEVLKISEHSHRKLNAKALNMTVRADGERLLLLRP